jgi:hypothetical protein
VTKDTEKADHVRSLQVSNVSKRQNAQLKEQIGPRIKN